MEVKDKKPEKVDKRAAALRENLRKRKERTAALKETTPTKPDNSEEK